MKKVSQYPVATMLRALEHYEAGWKPTRIREMLADEGLGSPSLATIYTWVNPSYRERCIRAGRDRQARQSAERARFRLSSNSDEYRMAFVQVLRQQGVSCNSIGVVHGVVFGERLTADQVRYMFRFGDPKPSLAGRPSAQGIAA